MSSRDEDDLSANSAEDTKGDVDASGFIGFDGIEGFRGFERQRQPKVSIERLDLVPYIEPKPRPILKETSRFSGLDKYFVKCTVDLVNQDLPKLKKLYSKDPNLLTDTLNHHKCNMSLKCKICEKKYASKRKLSNHEEKKHTIIYKAKKSKCQKRVSFSDKIVVHEVKEYHKCRKCPKYFESYLSLKTHMKEQHKKRKCYICNYCEKKFIDRMFFKVHIKLHCEACGQLFTSKRKCTDHKRSVCKIIKMHECKDCQCFFFKILDLKDHSYDHMDTCFVCDICKEQCKSKCAVAHHIYFLHSKRRKKQIPSLYTKRKIGSESLFLCKFCDESAVDKDIIELHVQSLPDLTNRAMAGYKDYYFCDQCPKEFDTEQDMLQHKWTHFLKTSESQEQKDATEKTIKTVYNANEKIPEFLQPKLVLEKLNLDWKSEEVNVVYDLKEFDIHNGKIKKIVDPKSKKTLISRYQCENCGKYYSSRYCLNRHKDSQHSDFENLRCKVCEEVFVWPSLLQRHKCLRIQIPEMPFEDARPEIHFDNLFDLATQNNTVTSTQEMGFDDLNIMDSDDYLNSVDFEIPAPIVELSEGVSFMPDSVNESAKMTHLSSNGYKLVMQEVPIEF